MSTDLVLNDLSVSVIAPDVASARMRMAVLMETIVSATRAGAAAILRAPASFSFTLLAAGYRVADWRSDPQVDRELQRLFRSITTKCPYLFDLPQESEKLLTTEFACNGHNAEGLGVAFLLEGVGLSLLTEPCWDTSFIQLQVDTLNPESELESRLEQVLHASRRDHVLQHAPILRARRAVEIFDPEDLWHSRADLFPALLFCESVRNDFEEIGRGALLQGLVRRLFELNDYCTQWSRGPFDGVGVSGDPREESAATLRQFSNERTFNCPDGQPRLFSWHLSLPPWGRRLYFYPENQRHVIFIGYVGQHLRTVRYQ